MDSSAPRPSKPDLALMSIGRLSRQTGITPDTLRMWERRYGAPRSVRLPSGHRRFTQEEGRRVTLAVQAMKAGRRPREVVAAPIERLLEILGQVQGRDSGSVARDIESEHRQHETQAALARWLEDGRRLDGASITRSFFEEWIELGPMRFLEERAVPLVEGVGDAWEQGDIGIRHEHFISEQLVTFLGTQWRRLSERAPRSPLLLATLSGELHHLGLTMVAVAGALADHQIIYLGAQTPPEEIIRAVSDNSISAVVVSFSQSSNARTSARWVSELRQGIPPKMPIVIGGDGAPPTQEGITRFTTLREFHRWALELP